MSIIGFQIRGFPFHQQNFWTETGSTPLLKAFSRVPRPKANFCCSLIKVIPFLRNSVTEWQEQNLHSPQFLPKKGSMSLSLRKVSCSMLFYILISSTCRSLLTEVNSTCSSHQIFIEQLAFTQFPKKSIHIGLRTKHLPPFLFQHRLRFHLAIVKLHTPSPCNTCWPHFRCSNPSNLMPPFS